MALWNKIKQNEKKEKRQLREQRKVNKQVSKKILENDIKHTKMVDQVEKEIKKRIDSMFKEMHDAHKDFNESMRFIKDTTQRDVSLFYLQREYLDTKLSLLDETSVIKRWVNEKMDELNEHIVERASKMEDLFNLRLQNIEQVHLQIPGILEFEISQQPKFFTSLFEDNEDASTQLRSSKAGGLQAQMYASKSSFNDPTSPEIIRNIAQRTLKTSG